MRGLTDEERAMLTSPIGTPVVGDYEPLVRRGLLRHAVVDGVWSLKRDPARVALALRLDNAARGLGVTGV